MPGAKAGVVTAMEVNMPNATPRGRMVDFGSPSTWSVVWFIIAVLLLFII